MEYGAGLTRTVHMDLDAHPDDIAPSRAGHSIGRWDGDTLVVDTVGFEPGSLAGSVPHSSALHIVERFTLNPATLELVGQRRPQACAIARRGRREGGGVHASVSALRVKAGTNPPRDCCSS